MFATRTLVLVSVCCALCGCELVANFDRGKIPISHHDAGAQAAGRDAGKKEAGSTDAGAGDAASSDAAQDDGG